MIWVEHRFGFETELFCDMGFDPRVDVGERPDGARERAGRYFPTRGNETLAVAGEFGIVPGELEAKGRRLRMDTVAAADCRRVLVLESAALECAEQGVEIGEQQVGRLLQLHGKRGVEHVARRHALVHKARFGPDMLGEIGQECDRLVMDLALNLADAVDLESGALANRFCRTAGDDFKFFLRLAGIDLDFELDAEIVFRRPNPGHLGAAVARDHNRAASSGRNCFAIKISSQYRPSCFNACLSIPYSTKPSLA